MKSPVVPGHLKKRLVLLLGKDYAGRVFLRGCLQALQRVRVEEQAALLVPRPRGPVEDCEQ